MECDVCGRVASTTLCFNCPTCARNALYPARFEHAAVLLEKDAVGRRVGAVAEGMSSGTPRESYTLDGKVVDTYDCAKTMELKRIKSETAALKDSAGSIHHRAEALRAEMEEYRNVIKAQKLELQKRRSDADSALYGLAERDVREMEFINAGIRRTRRRWTRVHEEIVAGRIALCRPAAGLAGLRRHKRPLKGGVTREFFTIGSEWVIPNLKELHLARPEELTAALTHLALLTARVANYLALRVPAEITLPHRDYPLATILGPSASYGNRDVPFPNGAPSISSANSSLASRASDSQALPSPRPLFARAPLAQLSRDDSRALVEGVTFLAWDIAWLCRTQGMMHISDEHDLADMGRNLWTLLFAESASEQNQQIDGTLADDAPRRFGQLSHGTAHSFLASRDDKKVMRDWTMQNPMLAASKIGDHLNGEMQRAVAEWEVLQEGEWSVDAVEEEAVLVGGRRADHERKQSRKNEKAKSTAGHAESSTSHHRSPRTAVRQGTSTPVDDQVAKPSRDPASPGTQGWTKVRSRSEQ